MAKGKLITISYTPFPQIDISTNSVVGEIFRPLAPVRLQLWHGSMTNIFDALVDSGSDRNLFPLEVGVFLGINFKKAKKTTIRGIGNSEITAFSHKISIWFNNEKYETEADFSSSQQAILFGRQGFFNLFTKIVFREEERYFDIEI